MSRLLLGVESALVVLLVVAVVSEHRARYVLKPLASLCFVGVGISESGSTPGRYAALILAGLILGFVGDVALLSKAARPFLLGLGAFLLGHIAYAVAFAPDVRQTPLFGGALVGIVLGWFSYRWLKPHLDRPFDAAVPLYVAVISLMVMLGIGQSGLRPLAAAGAVLFAASDLSVARDQFVHRSPINPAVGLPLYYLAQTLLAFSI